MKQDPDHSASPLNDRVMPEAVEVLLSALAGCGIVLMLAFFLSLETWLIAAAG
jgi:hypothetical protein